MIAIEREEVDMDKRASDQGWRQLQANIERFLEQSLRGDGRRLEYQPRFMVQQPEASPEYRRKEAAGERCQPGGCIAAESENQVAGN
jgi:hypothetical protein